MERATGIQYCKVLLFTAEENGQVVLLRWFRGRMVMVLLGMARIGSVMV